MWASVNRNTHIQEINTHIRDLNTRIRDTCDIRVNSGVVEGAGPRRPPPTRLQAVSIYLYVYMCVYIKYDYAPRSGSSAPLLLQNTGCVHLSLCVRVDIMYDYALRSGSSAPLLRLNYLSIPPSLSTCVRDVDMPREPALRRLSSAPARASGQAVRLPLVQGPQCQQKTMQQR